jgi:hypothetical protein
LSARSLSRGPEAFCAWLQRRFGCDDLPVERRVLGVMKYGATWLAMWFVVLFVGGLSLLLAGPAVLGLYFVGSAVAVALLLNWLSWPVWLQWPAHAGGPDALDGARK